MSEETLLRFVSLLALGIELLAVGLIVLVIGVATVNHLMKLLRHTDDAALREASSSYRRRIGHALLLGLEILVAADVVRTVTLERTLSAMAYLGALVIVRIALSWSLVVELEGRWPWQPARSE